MVQCVCVCVCANIRWLESSACNPCAFVSMRVLSAWDSLTNDIQQQSNERKSGQLIRMTWKLLWLEAVDDNFKDVVHVQVAAINNIHPSIHQLIPKKCVLLVRFGRMRIYHSISFIHCTQKMLNIFRHRREREKKMSVSMRRDANIFCTSYIHKWNLWAMACVSEINNGKKRASQKKSCDWFVWNAKDVALLLSSL